jgi:hypothetical protein
MATFDLRQLSTEDLLALRGRVDEELSQRRAAIDAVLSGKDPTGLRSAARKAWWEKLRDEAAREGISLAEIRRRKRAEKTE